MVALRPRYVAPVGIAALALPAAMLLPAVTASAAPARELSFAITSDPGSGITLGEQLADPVCTGERGDLTCVAPIGTSTSFADTASIVEGGTGRSGTMTISCSIMYAGKQTTYSTRPGSANATGSEDCSLALDFGSGDTVVGALHQSRVLVDNLETSTFDVVFTHGTGRYAGFTGSLVVTETNPWTPPPPIGDKPDPGPSPDPDPSPSPSPQPSPGAVREGIAATLERIVVPRAGDDQPAISVDRSKKPLVDVTSLGLLAPVNAPSKVAVTAAPGETCTGTLTAGKRVISLPAKKIGVAGGSVVLKALPAGALKGASAWKLRVTCGKKAAPFTRTLKTFEVLETKTP